MLRAVATAPTRQTSRQLFQRAFVAQQRCSTTIADPITVQSEESPAPHEDWLFVNSVFPIRLSSWDVRHYLGLFRKGDLLNALEEILQSVSPHGFQVLSIEPRVKDGGVFVNFRYSPSSSDKQKTINEIVKELKTEAAKHGGLPSWIGTSQGDIWPVRGQPWREDLRRFASPMLKVAFDGPDIREEQLYEVLRPFGQIADMTQPTPVPAGSLRSSIVTFKNLRSSVIAHNCVHGLAVPSHVPGSSTRLCTMFERPLKAHVVRDWITSHPRLVIPVVVFLLGSLTYTVFDPIRALLVEGKLMGWFDIRNNSLYKWLRENVVGKFSDPSSFPPDVARPSNTWKEREEAEQSIKAYLSDFPNTVTFLHGPQGSGKSRMLTTMFEGIERPVLVIDCADLYAASSDAAVLQSLSRQTGYKPVFPFVNSLNNLIDIASVGLIGQKAGMSTSLTEQVKDMLEVIGTALKSVSKHKLKLEDQKAKAMDAVDQSAAVEARRQTAIRYGTWHDGRLDCVAGNGIMSELGVGIERVHSVDYDVDPIFFKQAEEEAEMRLPHADRKQKSTEELKALQTMPIVVIKNYATRRGRDDIIAVMSAWAASLVENKVAHVIVASDNRENAKQLAQALPSKPLNSIALSDADPSSALLYVKQKLKRNEDDSSLDLTREQTKSIEQLGGRASDLEALVHKVRSGQGIPDAVEDIIFRSTNELRKNAFGDDTEDEKSLAWSRVQAWHVLRLLAKKEEISYHDLLLDFPFKGDEMALRNMEHAELISIVTQNGRPSAIRPGKPVYRFVFQRLVGDPVFRALQDIGFNEKKISSAEALVKACEEELRILKEIGTAGAHWWSRKSATAFRASYVAKKLLAAEGTIEKLEAQNADLKRLLVKSE